MVLDKFSQAKLRMNGKKCKFAVTQVKYLGHILSGSGVAVDPSKFDFISNWPTPKSARQVKSFLGVANYYGGFVQSFAQRSAPLRELTVKDKPFVWGKNSRNLLTTLNKC